MSPNQFILVGAISPHSVALTLYMWSLSIQLEQTLENKVTEEGLSFS